MGRSGIDYWCVFPFVFLAHMLAITSILLAMSVKLTDAPQIGWSRAILEEAVGARPSLPRGLRRADLTEDEHVQFTAARRAWDDAAEAYKSRFRGIYFAAFLGHIKIGAAQSVIDRVHTVGVLLPFEADPLGYVPVASAGELYGAEKKAHEALREYRVRGEWFRDCLEVRAYVALNAVRWPTRRDLHVEATVRL